VKLFVYNSLVKDTQIANCLVKQTLSIKLGEAIRLNRQVGKMLREASHNNKSLAKLTEFKRRMRVQKI
jgi:hypothetical protein